ncbi:hypothetical protein ACL1A8_13220, partial [Corynebacterium striatum]
LTGETRLRFWALAGQPPAVVPTNRKQAVPRSRNRGTNYPRSAGQNQLAKVTTLTRNENQADYETGQPALYDNGIDTEYTHSIGIQKGHI